ncbi:hypothetical protein BG000_005173 [Podila horticola]|nr:hypothetical protein BG000_005173 [Podila horticola]
MTKSVGSGLQADVGKDFALGTTNNPPEWIVKYSAAQVRIFEGTDGTIIFESDAIAHYHGSSLVGKGLAEETHIQQWMQFVDVSIGSTLGRWGFSLIRPALPFNKAVETDAVAQVKDKIKIDHHFVKIIYLIGERVTLADILAISTLHNGFKFAVAGEFVFSETAKKYTSPPKEKKEEKRPKKDEKEKTKEKAKEKEKDENEEVFFQDTPKPKSKLGLLPAAKMPENIDLTTDYSLRKVDYKYNDELTKIYMLNNLTDGFMNHLERARKYAFGCLVVAGEDNASMITGYFIVCGIANEMIEKVVDAADYESCNWVKVKVDDAERAKIDRFSRGKALLTASLSRAARCSKQEREPNWCLSALDKTQRSILGQAWLVHKKVPPPETMEWMAKLIDSHYKIVRYWFHCRVNFEAINKAMTASPDTGVLMPGIDNWYELEYFTHPPGAQASANAGPSSSRTPTNPNPRASSKTSLSTRIAKQWNSKQTTKHNKPATSKGQPEHLRAIQESSDDSSYAIPFSDTKDKSVARRQGVPIASKKRQAPFTEDEPETYLTEHARHATSSHFARRTKGRGVSMKGTDTAEQELPRKLSRYSSTNLKNIQVTVEIPVLQRRLSRHKRDATLSDASTEGIPSTFMMTDSSAISTREHTSDQPPDVPTAALSPANKLNDEVLSGRPSDEIEHRVTPSVAKVNKAESSTKVNKAESSTSTAEPSKISQRTDEHNLGSALSITRVTRRQGNMVTTPKKHNSDESIITKSLSNEPFASIKIRRKPKESGQADMLPTNVLPEPAPSSVASLLPTSIPEWDVQEPMLPTSNVQNAHEED